MNLRFFLFSSPQNIYCPLRHSAYDYYQNSEGIVFKDGKLVFVAKKLKKIFILNLDTGYYTSRPTNGKLFGDGSFNDGPDQIQWLPNNMIYYTEGKLVTAH